MFAVLGISFLFIHIPLDPYGISNALTEFPFFSFISFHFYLEIFPENHDIFWIWDYKWVIFCSITISIINGEKNFFSHSNRSFHLKNSSSNRSKQANPFIFFSFALQLIMEPWFNGKIHRQALSLLWNEFV